MTMEKFSHGQKTACPRPFLSNKRHELPHAQEVAGKVVSDPRIPLTGWEGEERVKKRGR